MEHTWEQYKEKRKADREFAAEDARKRREVRAAFEAELQEAYHIPGRIARLSRNTDDE